MGVGLGEGVIWEIRLSVLRDPLHCFASPLPSFVRVSFLFLFVFKNLRDP